MAIASAGEGSRAARSLVGRLDRLQSWAFPYAFIWIIGIGFLFTFYDIFDINVSWIQTCVQIKPGCTPETAADPLRLPVLINLAGYGLGTIVFSPLADRFGRRNLLLVTMAVTGVGSLWNGFVHDYDSFVAARGLTGIGIGADLAIVNTYVGEVAPRMGRAKYTSFIFVMSALGATLGVWLGLVLTTEPAPFPLGFPHAQNVTDGWRIMYWIGAGLALIGVLLRKELPESPRWLITRGRLDEAEEVVVAMEERARRRDALGVAVDSEAVELPGRPLSYLDIFSSRLYTYRALLLLVVWSAAYVTIYSYSAGFVSVLTGLHYPPPEAGMIVAIGVSGFLVCALFAYLLGERLERKLWLPVGAVLTVVGAVIVGQWGSTSVDLAFLGASIIFFGFNVWVPMTYAWSAENFPTRARTTGFALVDGLGHSGGAVGVLFIVPLLTGMSPVWALLVVTSFLCGAAVIAQLGEATRRRPLEEISP